MTQGVYHRSEELKQASRDRLKLARASAVESRRRNAVGVSIVDGYRMLTMQHDHPLVSSTGNGILGEHRRVLYEKIGPGPHACHWNCGKILEWGGLHGICTDHVDFNKQNNTPDNLVPSCYGCNITRKREK